MNKSNTGRFAPSPSGYMHIGNLLAMLLAWLDARHLGGELVFRMEDLDPARSNVKYAEAIADDLRWLGLDWDCGYPDPAFCQSRRSALYEDAFASLAASGLVYPCWCSRAERLAASAPHPGELQHDPGCRCARFDESERRRLMESGRRPAWKLRVPDIAVTIEDAHYGAVTHDLARDDGDFILRRADGVFAYQLAVSVDDAAMGIGRVVRGRDLLSSAPKQAWLITQLGGEPPVYAHAPLLLSGERKLSKRMGDLSTQALRSRFTPEALLGQLAHAAGLIDRPEPVSARELAAGFDWSRVTRDDIPLPPAPLPEEP